MIYLLLQKSSVLHRKVYIVPIGIIALTTLNSYLSQLPFFDAVDPDTMRYF